MNLRQIEKRFQNLNVQATMLDYRFNPNSGKIEGIQKHAYLSELRQDQEKDKKLFGKETYDHDKNQISKKSLMQLAKGASSQFADHVDLDDLKEQAPSAQEVTDYQAEAKRGGTAAYGKNSQMTEGGSQVRPQTSQPLSRANALQRRAQLINSRASRVSFAAKTTKSQHQLLQRKIQQFKKTCHYDWDMNSPNIASHSSQTITFYGRAPDAGKTASRTRHTGDGSTNNFYEVQSQDYHFSQKRKVDAQSHAGHLNSRKQMVQQSNVPNLLDRAKLQEEHIVMRQQQLPRSRPKRQPLKTDRSSRGNLYGQQQQVRLDKHNSEQARLEYLKQLERYKKQKEVQMNLDSLLEGLFQIRIPDHIIQELVAETGGEFLIESDRNTPIKVFTDKNALNQKESALAEDYKQSLGEMQMIQNLRISENGSGMLMKGPPMYHNTVNASQSELQYARNVNRCFSNASNPEQYLRNPRINRFSADFNSPSAVGLQTKVGMPSQILSPWNRGQNQQSNDKSKASTSPQQQHRLLTQKLSLNTPNQMSPRFAQVHQLHQQVSQANAMLKPTLNENVNQKAALLPQRVFQPKDNILLLDQNQGKPHSKYFMNQLENDYRDTSSRDRDQKSQSALFNSGSSLIKNTQRDEQARVLQKPEKRPVPIAVAHGESHGNEERQGQSASDILKPRVRNTEHVDGPQKIEVTRMSSQDVGSAKITQIGSEQYTRDQLMTEQDQQLSPGKQSTVLDPKRIPSDFNIEDSPTKQQLAQQMKNAAIIGGTSIEIKNNKMNFENDPLLSIDKVKVAEAQMMEGAETPLPAHLKSFDGVYEIASVAGNRPIMLTLKLTDLSDARNPFVILENRPLNNFGIVVLQDSVPFQDKDICQILPWLREPADILKRTIKLEVIYKLDVVMCRYLHLNTLYPVEYPKIALQICQNLYSNQYIKYKQSKLAQLLAASKKEARKGPKAQLDQSVSTGGPKKVNAGTGLGSTEESPSSPKKVPLGKDAANPDIVQHLDKNMDLQTIKDTTPIYVFDGSKNTVIKPEECILNAQSIQPPPRKILQNDGLREQLTDMSNSSIEKESQFYFVLPAQDRFYRLLQDARNHEFHLRELPKKIESCEIIKNSGIQPKDLIKFPKFQKNQQKILIEFQDCIIQANDLVDFQILVDDNKKRAKAMLQFEEDQRQSIGLVRGRHVSKDPTKSSFNTIFQYNDKSVLVLKQELQKLKQTHQEQQQKELSKVSQSRGAETLIRKYQNKRAEEFRRLSERRPLGPNQDLLTHRGVSAKSPTCAAELKDEQAVRGHLINTSLLTAPLFYRTADQPGDSSSDMEMVHFWNYQQLQNAQNTKPILSKNVFTMTQSKLGDSGTDMVDELAYFNGLATGIPALDNFFDTNFRPSEIAPQIDGQNIHIMTQTEDYDQARSLEEQHIAQALHSAQKTEEMTLNALAGSNDTPSLNNFQKSALIGNVRVARTSKHAGQHLQIGYKHSLDKGNGNSTNRNIAQGHQRNITGTDRDSVVRSVFSLNQKQQASVIKKKESTYSSRRLGLHGQISRPEINGHSVAIFGSKMDMNDKTIAPTIQLSKHSQHSSQQSKGPILKAARGSDQEHSHNNLRVPSKEASNTGHSSEQARQLPGSLHKGSTLNPGEHLRDPAMDLKMHQQATSEATVYRQNASRNDVERQ